jgi:hypothetical protein
LSKQQEQFDEMLKEDSGGLVPSITVKISTNEPDILSTNQTMYNTSSVIDDDKNSTIVANQLLATFGSNLTGQVDELNDLKTLTSLNGSNSAQQPLEIHTSANITTRGQCYETLYSCNLFILLIS